MSKTLTSDIKLAISLNLRNAAYVRTNTIALRKLAQENKAETAQVQRLAEASWKDSHEMRRLALLTMFYLPPTFAAVSRCYIDQSYIQVYMLILS